MREGEERHTLNVVCRVRVLSERCFIANYRPPAHVAYPRAHMPTKRPTRSPDRPRITDPTMHASQTTSCLCHRLLIPNVVIHTR